jgi:hypothetical protein
MFRRGHLNFSDICRLELESMQRQIRLRKGSRSLDACGGSNFPDLALIRAGPSWKRGWRRSEVECAVASLFKVRVDNLNHVLSRFLTRF